MEVACGGELGWWDVQVVCCWSRDEGEEKVEVMDTAGFGGAQLFAGSQRKSARSVGLRSDSSAGPGPIFPPTAGGLDGGAQCDHSKQLH